MKTKPKTTFDYGRYLLEYREDKDSVLLFLKKTISDVDEALREADKLKDKGFHDVMIRSRAH